MPSKAFVDPPPAQAAVGAVRAPGWEKVRRAEPGLEDPETPEISWDRTDPFFLRFPEEGSWGVFKGLAPDPDPRPPVP